MVPLSAVGCCGVPQRFVDISGCELPVLHSIDNFLAAVDTVAACPDVRVLRAVVLIIDDPDAPDPAAPRMVWVHWVLYDIPPEAMALPEAVDEAALPPGTKQGRNDWKRRIERYP